MNAIGIRREDKSIWEARTPIVPADLDRLRRDHGLAFCVESSSRRAFSDDQFRAVGAEITDNLATCPVIMGVKEIPREKLEPNKTYVYFSHTIKGQSANMPMLRRLMELECQLIDYERIADDGGRRLVFFGRFAGLAGMIDTLWATGQRWREEGIDTPLATIKPAHRYTSLDDAQKAIKSVGNAIEEHGLPAAVTPFVCGFAGYGQVSQGAQSILDLLPFRAIAPADLPDVPKESRCVFKVVFHERDMVARRGDAGTFDLREYYDYPSRYEAAFVRHVPHLTVLVNCIYWEPKYPRLVTRENFAELYANGDAPRLRTIGDITCDIDGSLACTTRATDPGNPVYVYDPTSGHTTDGVAGRGPVVLAVDFLPCELPVDSSQVFSATLLPFVPALAKADFTRAFDACGLSAELSRATILYKGRLTEPFRYLEAHLR